MQNLSLKRKILLMILGVSLIGPVIAGIIIFRNNETSALYKVIAQESLPRTRQMGTVLFSFRQVRLLVRDLAARGMEPEQIKSKLPAILAEITEFKKQKEYLETLMSKTEEEKKMIVTMNNAWSKFETLGGTLIGLAKIADDTSMSEYAHKVRNICPGISSEFEKSVSNMIEWQEKDAIDKTEMAIGLDKKTQLLSICLTILSIVISLMAGIFFASNLVNKISESVKKLGQSAGEIFEKSNEVAHISSTLSSAATQQAASLQETVSSIDEISAMISRNSDAAQTSSQMSDRSTKVAQEGKEKVGLMMESIHSIAKGNNEIIDQMQKSNREISEIVNVINDISLKTQVINDIVFQTKLLSFNASVEAARAGEHGKGFAVVAEEVGNLAAMSGKAATEITDMLSKSTKQVTEIIGSSKLLMDSLITQSKSKVDQGTITAEGCAKSLDEILSNVSSVNEMVLEISTASKEQSTGVIEVNKAMSELDHVTQQNSSSAQLSSEAAVHLNSQVERLHQVVLEISNIVDGSRKKSEFQISQQSATVTKSNVFNLPARNVRVEPTKRKAVGAEIAPSNSDPRFEDA